MACVARLYLTCLCMHVGLVWHNAVKHMHLNCWQSPVLNDMQHVVTMRPAATRFCVDRYAYIPLWSKDQAAAVSCSVKRGLLIIEETPVINLTRHTLFLVETNFVKSCCGSGAADEQWYLVYLQRLISRRQRPFGHNQEGHGKQYTFCQCVSAR